MKSFIYGKRRDPNTLRRTKQAIETINSKYYRIENISLWFYTAVKARGPNITNLTLQSSVWLTLIAVLF